MKNNKSRLDKLKAMIPIFCEKTGEEFIEREWQAGGSELHKVESILSKPKVRQEDALAQFVQKLGIGEPFSQGDDEEIDGLVLRKCVRFVDALEKTAKEAGNFKAKAALERIGGQFFDSISDTLFSQFDPTDIVKLRKEGKL